MYFINITFEQRHVLQTTRGDETAQRSGFTPLMSVGGGLGQTVLGHLYIHISEGEGMVAVVLVVLIGADIQRLLGLWRRRRRCSCRLCQNGDTK